MKTTKGFNAGRNSENDVLLFSGSFFFKGKQHHASAALY